ncbi:MAG TPA: energy transducer TonB [Gemmatimonadaceae bacterium]|nr:energy transducer TonB [Gemmatimonadaceae bacterium]
MRVSTCAIKLFTGEPAMFTTLLESKPKAQRSIGGSIVSMAAHAFAIVLAIQATLNAGQKREDRATEVQYTEIKPDAPPPRKIEQVQIAPAAKGFQTLTAPVNIPDVLPQIDFSRKETDARDWTGIGAPGGAHNGVTDAPPVENQVYFEYQVEKPVVALSNSATPRYPEVLKAAGVEGEVVATFVVDTTGRADAATFKILKSPSELFSAAVRAALPNMRFLPAEAAGKKVKQQVQQSFVFAIVK